MPELTDKPCECGHCCCTDCSCVKHYECKCDKCGWRGDFHKDGLWPEEAKAIEKYLSGKMKFEEFTPL